MLLGKVEGIVKAIEEEQTHDGSGRTFYRVFFVTSVTSREPPLALPVTKEIYKKLQKLMRKREGKPMSRLTVSVQVEEE